MDSAILGSLPVAVAVERIIPLMNDWYLSGITAPDWSTTVAAPIELPVFIYMESHAMLISAPAEAACMLTKAMTGLS